MDGFAKRVTIDSAPVRKLIRGEERSIGSIAVGNAADRVVLTGNPEKNIDDVQRVETVF